MDVGVAPEKRSSPIRSLIVAGQRLGRIFIGVSLGNRQVSLAADSGG